MGKVPSPKGRFSREILTKVIHDYIYAYRETTKQLRQPSPTLMFVLYDVVNEGAAPVVVPFSLNAYEIDSLEGFAALLIEQYPASQYNLEMVIYARYDVDHLKKGEFNVLFGARDIGGCSLHSQYHYKRYKQYEELTHKNNGKKYFDVWLQNPVIKDDFLNAAVANYFTAVNMKVKRTYAH